MNKVKELEKKWFKYKLKKVTSPFLSLSIVSVMAGSGYYFYDVKKDFLPSLILAEQKTSVLGVSIDNNNTNKIETKLPLKVEHQEVKVEKLKVEEVEKPKSLSLSPIIPVIDMEKEERIPNTNFKRTSTRTPKTSVRLVSAKKNNYLTPKELTAIIKTEKRVLKVPRKTKKMNFKSTTVNYMETLKQKFSKSKNPREALLLAKAYYSSANYKEAEKWALAANKLNNSSEESWLVFAKSKAKLGKKRESLKVLVSYYKKSNSIKAKRLILQIKAGKL